VPLDPNQFCSQEFRRRQAVAEAAGLLARAAVLLERAKTNEPAADFYRLVENARERVREAHRDLTSRLGL